LDSIERVKSAVADAIDNYNAASKKKINIVLFEDALRMLCKINRIMGSPFGHALLIGLGGSGSHTLTRLATFMQDYTIYEIEMEKDFSTQEWLDFIRDMLRNIVLKSQSGVFLISDA